MKTYIIGHTKPDTDSVVAPLALQKLYESDECFGYKGTTEVVIADPLNPETTYLFEKFGVDTPRQITKDNIETDDKVILVDHNEASQRLSGVEESQIVEIIDHHKANVNFNKPIFMTLKPWGSSASIAYFLLQQNNIKIDTTLASLMLAAILSDTVGFKSPTTTEQDKKFGKELAEIAKIDDIEAFTLEIFKAKSNVGDLTDKQIVINDYKIFDFHGKKVFIDQLETVEQEEVIKNKKQGLLKAMEEVKQEHNVDLIFVAITDILQVNTKLLILGNEEEDIATKAFGGKVEESVLDIGPKLSRKKEIAPKIEESCKM